MKALFGNQRVNLCKWGKKSLKLIFGIKLGLSPMSYIDKKDPKFLVIHGDADPVVPYCQSEYFSKALKDAGMSSVQIAQMTGLDVGYIDTI